MTKDVVVVARPSASAARHAPKRGLLLGGDPYDPKRKRRKNRRLQKIAALAVALGVTMWMVGRLGGGSGGRTARRRTIAQRTESISQQLDRLSAALPLAPEGESSFLAVVKKECRPGRDDVGDDINPTTKRRRECLRHVPLVKGTGKRQLPRIGVMVPPGFIGRSFGHWISNALEKTGKQVGMEVDVILGSHVPVYGYGRSHGFTKLIRFVSLPLSLAVYDAYQMASAGEIDDEMKLGGNLHPPSVGSIDILTRLSMRWHCRLSHVSMHTAMLTLPLGDVVKHPADTLTKVLTYIWKENWDWEGQGEEANEHKQQNPPGGWRRAAEDLIAKDSGGHLEELLDRTATLIQETTPGLRGDGDVFKTALQGAFAAEMKRSNDMTVWPCPSFWEGVEADGGATEEEAVRRIAGEMVPDCGDDHPFARCTIKRDKCELARDAKCT
ncbi:hypothetical protein ACHAXT_009095 [Thalassiosira profunda]